MGCDAGRKTKGCKRFMLVDTWACCWGGAVQPAHTPERAGAQALREPLRLHFPGLRKLWVDDDYRGPDFAAWVEAHHARLKEEVRELQPARIVATNESPITNVSIAYRTVTNWSQGSAMSPPVASVITNPVVVQTVSTQVE